MVNFVTCSEIPFGQLLRLYGCVLSLMDMVSIFFYPLYL